jgi:LysM repeat protein
VSVSRKARRFFVGYALLALAVIAAVSVATYFAWAEPEPSRYYTAQPGDTWENLALRYSVSVRGLLRANGLAALSRPLREGESVVIPPPRPAPAEVWQANGLGILAELAGAAVGLWLAARVGLLPKRVRRGMVTLSLALAAVSYGAGRVVAIEPLALLSSEFIFAAVKDGFTWSASLALIARAAGVSGRKK